MDAATKAIAFFNFIMLTQLDGTPIWVESSKVEIIRGAHTGKTVLCQAEHGAAIRIAGKGLCVKETPDDIRAKIEGR